MAFKLLFVLLVDKEIPSRQSRLFEVEDNETTHLGGLATRWYIEFSATVHLLSIIDIAIPT